MNECNCQCCRFWREHEIQAIKSSVARAVAEKDGEIAELKKEIETLKRHWIEDDRDLNELMKENESLQAERWAINSQLGEARADSQIWQTRSHVLEIKLNKCVEIAESKAREIIDMATGLRCNPAMEVAEEIRKLR